MAIKGEGVREWVRVLVPVMYLMLLIMNSGGEDVTWRVKYYYYGHRAFHHLTRWAREYEVAFMEAYYDAINQ